MEQPLKGPSSKEKPEPVEKYNKAEWGKLKQGRAGAAILKRGKEMGVPQEELDTFFQDYAAREKVEGNYAPPLLLEKKYEDRQ
ncbi:MAG: hypothetical protein HY434_02755 [Candidatus Liptonbacteria bacterium]|nr:hypothetical protein [Candidatus Liptonbacteria bacterium]